MRNLAIIPARSGSKGLRDKNIKELCGKPLMAHSIESAIKSGVFSEVMVSTDSVRYAEIAKMYGATVPFYRTELTSSDKASSWDAVREVISMYDKLSKRFDTICLLQPTSPLRNARDICCAYDIYSEMNAIAVVSVCEMEHSPLLCNVLPEDYSLDGFIRPDNNKRRQDMKIFYRINGAIYILKTDLVIEKKNIYEKGNYAYIMPQKRSIDIDTEEDFEMAEFLMRKKSELTEK